MTPNTAPTEALPPPAEWALQLAAQAWCDPSCSDIEMDERLATVFAQQLTKLAASFEAGRTIRAGDAAADGVWVPRKATLEMGWAYLEAARLDSPYAEHVFNHAGYRAMIAARPAP